MQNVTRSSRGFTLIEILISLFIMVVLSTAVFVSFRTGDKNLALERSAHQMAQHIRKAMEMSLQAEQSSVCGDPSDLSGYGLYVDEGSPTTYLLYANCNGEDSEGYDASQDESVTTFSLDEAIEISDVSNGENSDKMWGIVFFPPDPRIEICTNDPCNGANQVNSGLIELRVKSDPSFTRTITINQRGTIDVD